MRKVVDGIARVKVGFACDGWPVEIYAQSVPTREKNGYKHMVVENRLLQLFGEEMRQTVRAPKERGMKTEPSFARLLGLAGDPYRRLLELYELDDEQLRRTVGTDANVGQMCMWR